MNELHVYKKIGVLHFDLENRIQIRIEQQLLNRLNLTSYLEVKQIFSTIIEF